MPSIKGALINQLSANAYSGDIDPQIRDIDPLILEGLLMM